MIGQRIDEETQRLMALRGGVETNAEHIADGLKRSRPWSTDDYERVRLKAVAVVRGYRMIPLPGVDRATVDGTLIWDLISALDRVGAKD